MSKVFISYARADREWAHLLAQMLGQRGHEVWWDHMLVAGQSFRNHITLGLNEADFVIVLWSHSSIGSFFVIDEAQVGSRAGKLVPLAIEDVEPPIGFRQIHTTRITNLKNQVELIVASLNKNEGDVPFNLIADVHGSKEKKHGRLALILLSFVAFVTVGGGIAVLRMQGWDKSLNEDMRYRQYISESLKLKFVYPQKYLIVDNSQEASGLLSLITPQREIEIRIVRAMQKTDKIIQQERDAEAAMLQQKGFSFNYIAPAYGRPWSNWYILSGVMPDGREFYYKRWRLSDVVVSIEYEYPRPKLELYHAIIEDMMNGRFIISE